jgi:hypothetical protein
VSSPRAQPDSRKRFNLPRGTWVGGVIVVLLVLLFAVSSGWSGTLLAIALVGVFTGFYAALSGRRSWALIASRKIGAAIVVLCFVVLFVGAGIAPHPKVVDESSAQTNSAKPQPARTAPAPSSTPTPTPAPIVVGDASSQAAAAAQATLVSEGFAVQMVDTDGTAVSDPSGLIVVDEVPPAGSSESPGSSIVLTLGQPSIAPAPAPAPAPAAPVPAAPAPVVPASPAGPLVTPGAFCPDADQGEIGHSSTGKTYTCGGHGADANGHLHWNTD